MFQNIVAKLIDGLFEKLKAHARNHRKTKAFVDRGDLISLDRGDLNKVTEFFFKFCFFCEKNNILFF
jgi:hypothetical protein